MTFVKQYDIIDNSRVITIYIFTYIKERRAILDNINSINSNRNSVKNPTYIMAYIVAAVLYISVFALCVVLFGLVTYQASGVILNLTHMIALVAALAIAFILCTRCAKEHKIKNLGIPVSTNDKLDFFDPDQTRNKKTDIYFKPRDTFYYLGRLSFFVLMIVLMNIAACLVAMCAVALLGGVLLRMENAFFREFVVKAPAFVLYLSLVYKMLVRYGFIDSQKKIFNANFKMITFITTSMIMIPTAVCDSFFCIPAVQALIVNIQTVFNPNIGVYIVEEDGFMVLNESFGAGNVAMICAIVLFTFLLQICIFRFAYNRGKKIFIKQHIRQVDEYEMDENI